MTTSLEVRYLYAGVGVDGDTHFGCGMALGDARKRPGFDSLVSGPTEQRLAGSEPARQQTKRRMDRRSGSAYSFRAGVGESGVNVIELKRRA